MSKLFLDWKQKAVKDGRGFNVTVGALSTGILGGGAGTVILIDLPELMISVPTGTVIMPFDIGVQCTVAAAVANHDINEILIAADIVKATDGTGTMTTEVAYNLRRDASKTTACTVYSAFTAATTAPVNAMELARKEQHWILDGNGQTATRFDLLYHPEPPPLLVGPCCLLVYFGGTSATTGYIQAKWLEYDTADL